MRILTLIMAALYVMMPNGIQAQILLQEEEPAAVKAAPIAASERTQVILLGTGNPNPIADRFGPSTLIIVDGTPYLFDAGPGVVRRAAEAFEKYRMETLRVEDIHHVFLTHLHSDHTLGLADMMLTPWVMGREAPLQIVGPRGTSAMVASLRRAYRVDIDGRLKGLEPANETGWKTEVAEFSGRHFYRDDKVRISAFPVCHGNWRQAAGYRIETPDRTIVISGDTSYCPKVEQMARGADILIHEAYSTRSFERLGDDWATYHSAYHTSSTDLARLAKRAKPKLLVLYHQLTWGGDDIDLIREEIEETYDGKVVTGRDLDLF